MSHGHLKGQLQSFLAMLLSSVSITIHFELDTLTCFNDRVFQGMSLASVNVANITDIYDHKGPIDHSEHVPIQPAAGGQS